MTMRPWHKNDDEIVVTLDATQEHALRNHFGVILGYCEAIALDLPLDDQARADLGEIQKAATAAMQLIARARQGAS
jgi:hypothetical protein